MKVLIAAASLVTLASAHGGISMYTIDGTNYAGWEPFNNPSGQKSVQRQYSSFNPLLTSDLGSVNIRCNNNGALGTGLSAAAKAGSKIKATWKQWTHRPAAVMVFMAKCPSSGCNGWDGSGKVWFKIDDAGLISGTQNKGIWIGDQVVDKLYYESTIPSNLASGEYLIRHDILALHQANNPQFYPECAQLTVTGSGSDSPSGDFLVSFPGAYSASHPGINFNIDNQNAMVSTCYDIPGPAVWPSGRVTKCGSTGGGSSATPTGATTLIPVPSPTSVCSPVAKWNQCGGQTYNGCTTCAEGTCNKINDFYSQCI